MSFPAPPRGAASPRAGGRGRGCTSSGCAPAAGGRPATGRRSGRRAGGPKARGRTHPPGAGRSLPGSGRAGSAGRQPGPRAPPARASLRRYERGSTPTICTRFPRSSIVRESSVRRVAGSRSTTSAGCENGSRVSAKSWLPSTAKQFGIRASIDRSSASPERRESRSPLIIVRSGCRSSTQSTARATATRPRDGKPRWKSDRCAIRRPSSSGGSPGSGQASVSSRTHPPRNDPTPARPPLRRLRAVRLSRATPRASR